MNYPLISEFIEAIKSPEDYFDKLRHLQPVLDDDGNPYMSSGHFAVVFKMTDGQKKYAIKCFTHEQEGRKEAYQQIAEELENVSSPFLCPIQYLEKELFVDTKNSTETEFPILLMDWVEGVTLDKFVRNNLHNQYALESLAYNFCRMAQWLLTQPFAHGDLKPDNILVQSDGALVLVDYDGMFVPAMKGGNARELGSPNYRHPLRTGEQFDEHLDDFALACIALSLKAIALKPELYDEFGTADQLLFSEDDFRNLAESKVIGKLQPLMSDADFQQLYDLFLIAYSEQSLANVSFRLFQISKPAPVEILSTKATDEEWAEAWEDEFGVKYSKDGKKLLKGKNLLDSFLDSYSIKPGTKVICDEAFSWCESLQSINIPNSVTSIGNEAFSWCNSLQSIHIPNSVTSIGDGAFSDCESLQSIDIPNSVTSIGDTAFSGCNLQIDIDSSKFYSNGYCLIDLSSHRLLCCHRNDLKNYTIPNSVTSIGDLAFSGCDSLQSIHIPNSVTSIGDWAFSGCESLQSIHIPNSVTSIGDKAFFSCKSLQSIHIPNSVTSIGKEAFSWCFSLQSITIPNSVTSIGDDAFFLCFSLQSINIPNSVTSIGDTAFRGCSSLQSIHIPNSVTSIGDGAFSQCNLQIDIDSSKFYSDGYCLIDSFSHRLLSCHRNDLKNYTIPNSVTSIGDSAFCECDSLQSINIPNSVTSIGYEAFSDCKSLQSITIPNSVTSIGNSAFSLCYSLQSINIPNSVTSIGDYAFFLCSSLQSIHIPNSVTSIGENAFSSCHSLQSIHIPNSVTSIGDGAFSGCESLQSIHIPNSVTSIGYSAFSLCDSLQSIHIPNSVTSIGNSAFFSCFSLQSINIPNSVTSIGDSVFWGCSSLQSINIPRGTREKFEKLLPDYWEKLVEIDM